MSWWRKLLRWGARRMARVVAVGLIVVVGLVGFMATSSRSVAPDWMVAPVRAAVTMLTPASISDVLLPETLPDQASIKTKRWLEQGWSNIERFWFHHAPQGTSTLPLPYSWLVALQQPGISFVGRSQLFVDPEYLRQFGFIPSPRTLQTSDTELEAGYGYPDEDERAHEHEAATRAPAIASQRRPSMRVPERLQRRLPENIDGLPVGFARTPGFIDPTTGRALPDQIGLTCAACHTGELQYKGTSMRIDGGAAMVNLLAFQKAIVQAMWYTDKVPGRFAQFADRVLGADHEERLADKLRDELRATLARISSVKGQLDKLLDERGAALRASGGNPRDAHHVVEGYGRLDALNRIGNQVFHTNLLAAGVTDGQLYSDASKEKRLSALGFDLDKNFARHSAPVSFPPIWNTPWHLWAQYDASILQPIIRNAGEALGVAARINVTNTAIDKVLYRSSVDVKDLHNIEEQLSGPNPWDRTRIGKPGFQGLTAPRWADAAKQFVGDKAWAIDEAKVKAGRKLYAEICAECHMPPIRDPLYSRETGKPDLWDEATVLKAEYGKAEYGSPGFVNPDGAPPKYWRELAKQRYLIVTEKSAAEMGTDMAMARALSERLIKLPDHLDINPAVDMKASNCGMNLPGKAAELPFGIALMAIVEKTVQQWFRENPGESRAELIGDRPNCPNPLPVPQYRARSLDGMWATAPFLHNGSVRNLWELLSPDPERERPVEFCVGSKEFDPVRLGVSTECAPGTFRLDTRIPGNNRRGHEFTADKKPDKVPVKGVVGRKLTTDERWSIIEYLKTL